MLFDLCSFFSIISPHTYTDTIKIIYRPRSDNTHTHLNTYTNETMCDIAYADIPNIHAGAKTDRV